MKLCCEPDFVGRGSFVMRFTDVGLQYVGNLRFTLVYRCQVEVEFGVQLVCEIQIKTCCTVSGYLCSLVF